ncbi:MAG: holo-ACP synthase [Treponema sp.]|nr:holo-ACP synthase [Treponema sp.]
MIFGIGTDIAEVRRFESWINNPDIITRFFNSKEINFKGTLASRCQHLAARFAAKEAFSKALGTGLIYDLKDSYIINNDEGKPALVLENSAKEIFEKRCGNYEDYNIHISLSHEKEYAIAYVIIEKK